MKANLCASGLDHDLSRRLLLASSAILLGLAIPSCRPSSAAALDPAAHASGDLWVAKSELAAHHVETGVVGEEDVDDTISTGGTVTLDDVRTGHVFSPVTGRVVQIVASLGQRVRAGDALAIIESPDIGSAVSDVHKAEADLIAAQHDLQRKKELFAANAASQADVESSEDTYRSAKAEIERARQKQFLLRVGNVDAVTQRYTLTSPIDGEVLMRNVNPGIEVQGQYSGGANLELFTIGELDRVWVLGDIYEIDLPRVRVGQKARVLVASGPDDVFDGSVDWVSGGLDPATRTAKIRCTFDNPKRVLRPMMYAKIAVSVDERKAVAVPRDALLPMGDYQFVFVQTGSAGERLRFERLPIDVDVRGPGPWVEVKHGLDVGQTIAVKGVADLAQQL